MNQPIKNGGWTSRGHAMIYSDIMAYHYVYRSPTKGSRRENQRKRQTVWLLNPGCLICILIMVYGRIPTELGSRIPYITQPTVSFWSLLMYWSFEIKWCLNFVGIWVVYTQREISPKEEKWWIRTRKTSPTMSPEKHLQELHMEKQQKQHCNFPEKKQNNQHQNQNNNKSNLSYSGHDFFGGDSPYC